MTTRLAKSRLAERARELLAAGPSDCVALIEYVCQLPGAPRVVAEHMADALFAGRPEFARDDCGRWWLVPSPAARERTARGESARADSAPMFQPRDIAGARGAREVLAELPYVVVDVETTGTRPYSGDRVTEIAAVVVRDGTVSERFESLVNPERSIPPFITALTHISWDMVKDAPRFRDVCDDFLRLLEGNVFVAHNAEFDWRFVSAEVSRALGRQLIGRRLCTVRMSRRLLPQLRSRRLDSVALHYGVDITARHRALGDAVATAHILLRLLSDARDVECHCWDDLQELLRARRRAARRRRPSAMPRSVTHDTTA